MPHPLQYLWWLLLDVWHAQTGERPITISDERINNEERDAKQKKMRGEDLEYRARVMRRMTTGESGRPSTWMTAKRMAPLYSEPVIRKWKRARRKKNVVPMREAR